MKLDAMLEKLLECRADYVINDMSELPALTKEIS